MAKCSARKINNYQSIIIEELMNQITKINKKCILIHRLLYLILISRGEFKLRNPYN